MSWQSNGILLSTDTPLQHSLDIYAHYPSKDPNQRKKLPFSAAENHFQVFQKHVPLTLQNDIGRKNDKQKKHIQVLNM